MSNSSRTVVEVVDVSKKFSIAVERRNSLFGTLRSLVSGSTQKRDLWSLRDVSFVVGEGEALGVVGSNGSGKSTLLRLIEGVYAPTRGTIRLRHHTLSLLQLGMGLKPELTVRENVLLYGAILGLGRRGLLASLDDLLDFAGLSDFAAAKVKSLSWGMVQRLSFSVAIQSKERILLCDEVFSVGDASFVQKCLAEFHRFKSEGRTILLVSHQESVLSDFCQRTLVLEQGRLAFLGPTGEALSAYREICERKRASG